ncbi:MAG: hypothetical protein ACK422_14645 [Burkholderiales bacterium]|jgi:hypothetical protein
MNTWLGLVNHSALLPSLAMQQFFHAVIWLAVLSWLGVQCLPSYDRRWRWVMCSIAALLVLLMWQSVLPSLGLVFQTPSLMTLCACLAVAWGDIKGPSSRLFGSHDQARLSPGLWLVVVLVGWCLSLDAFGWLPWDVYSMGFEPRLLWLAWGVLGLWMATAYLLPLPDGHAKAATCCLLATGLFVVTQAPSGNVWDAWLDPGLWLFAHYQWIRHGGFHRTRINHS